MAVRRLLDSSGGVLTEFHHDEADDKITISTTYDAEPFIEANKHAQREGLGKSKSGDLWHVGHFDWGTLWRWAKEDGLTLHRVLGMRNKEFEHWIRKKLLDLDNAYLAVMRKF